jgi:serine/threonine-protein kinase
MNEPGHAPVRPGDLLAGKYRVERVLGVGGMGIVVAARHEQLDQLVAIKFVRNEALSTSDAAERFLREARAAARLKSDHVAKVLDVGKLETGAPYMVMELLEGSDLAEVLSTRGPMDLQMASWLVLQACEAVAEAHACGIVHRDLKPQNLFLTRTVGGSPKLKVLDFGVSKAVGLTSGGMGALTRTRAMLGSPLYMAPEQMRSSRDVDARADVWALGVVLFELLTGRWPFEAETMPELCLKVVSEPPVSLATLRPDAPAEFVAVVDRCLQKEASGRYANAAELATALEQFAPPPSRVLAEHARMALQFAPTSSTPSSGRGKDVVTLPNPNEGARPGSLPSAWGGSLERTPTPRTGGGRRTALWSVGAGLCAIAGVLVLSRVGRHDGSPPPVTSPAAAVPVHEVSEPVSSPPPPATVAIPMAPTATAVEASVAPRAPLANEASSPPPAPPPPPQPAIHPVPIYRPSPVRPSAARPAMPDDDIPALR